MNEPTHPGGVVDEHALSKGWRLGIASAWRAMEHRPGCAEARQVIAQLGNDGPDSKPFGLPEHLR